MEDEVQCSTPQFDGCCRFDWFYLTIGQNPKLVALLYRCGMKPFKSWWGPVLPHPYRNQGVASCVRVKFFWLGTRSCLTICAFLLIGEWTRSNYVHQHMWNVSHQTESLHIISTNNGIDADFCGCDWRLLFGSYFYNHVICIYKTKLVDVYCVLTCIRVTCTFW